MPYEPVTLGLKFAIRVHHLTARDVLVVNCPACHKAYWVATYILYERCGRSSPPLIATVRPVKPGIRS